MTDDQIQYWNDYIHTIREHLRLRDWNLLLGTSVPDNTDHLACITPTYGRQVARIELSHAFLTDTPENQRQTIVHELLHLHTNRAANVLDRVIDGRSEGWLHLSKEFHTEAIEYTTDILADIIAPFLPLPPSDHDSDDWAQQALAGPRLENTDDDIFATIDISLLGRWERHQNDPILKGGELRQNHHLYALP